MKHLVIFICLLAILPAAAEAQGQDFRREMQTAYELERQGRTAAARDLFEKLHREHPHDYTVFTRLRDIYLKTGSWEQALRLVEEREKDYPADPVLPISRGQIYYRQDKKEEALALWQHVIDTNSLNQSVYILIANNLLQERLVDEALEVYRQGRERLGKPHLFAFYVANIHASLMEYGKAAAELLAHLVENPGQHQIVESQLLRLARTETDAREIEREIRRVISEHPELVSLYLTISFIRLQSGQDSEALKAAAAFESREHGQEKGAGMLQLARRAFNSGRAETALKAFGSILDDFPRFSRKDVVRYEMAACQAALDRYEDAAALYDGISDGDPESPLRAQALLKSAGIYSDRLLDLQKARDRCLQLRARFPGTNNAIQAGLILAGVYLAEGLPDAADSVCADILSSAAGLPEPIRIHALVLRAESLLYLHDIGGSSEILSFIDSTDVSGPDPGAPAFNDGLQLKLLVDEYGTTAPGDLHIWADADFLQRQHRSAEALTRLDSYLAAHPDTPAAAELILKKADLLLTLHRHRDLLEFMETIYDRFAHHPIADRILVTAARAAAALGKDRRAAQLYETLLLDYPGSRFNDEARQQLRTQEEAP
ncbi:tetratricopeptide repeat protein [bacterium]|nr:tetratricopeptide repeat protein [bacterium]